jgi:hypothetical protein
MAFADSSFALDRALCDLGQPHAQITVMGWTPPDGIDVPKWSVINYGDRNYGDSAFNPSFGSRKPIAPSGAATVQLP